MSVLVSFSARTSKLVRGGMGILQLDTSNVRPPPPSLLPSYPTLVLEVLKLVRVNFYLCVFSNCRIVL